MPGLGTCNQLTRADDELNKGWRCQSQFIGTELAGKTLGVIGAKHHGC